MGEAQKRFPADCHPQSLFTEMAKEYGFLGLYYLDLYPFSEPMVIVLDPAVGAQTNQFVRHPVAHKLLRGLVGTKSIFSVEGAEWQAQHSWLSPAFSLQHLLTLVPSIVEETLIFKEKMTQYAVSGERFNMNEAAMRLTIDVIARTGLDLRIGSQREDSPLFAAFEGAIAWGAGFTDPLLKKILSPFMMDYHTRTLDKLLSQFVKERYASGADDKVTKTIIDLARRGYLKENGKGGNSVSGDLDPEFVKIAVDK
jgi:sterigmatocystin biosynthesis cytochrome P450 monooxygenase